MASWNRVKPSRLGLSFAQVSSVTNTISQLDSLDSLWLTNGSHTYFLIIVIICFLFYQDIVVFPFPDRPGHFEAMVPMVLNDEWDTPYQLLTLVGELTSPRLWFDPLAIVLTPVPLDTAVSAEFQVMASNYTRYEMNDKPCCTFKHTCIFKPLDKIHVVMRTINWAFPSFFLFL